MLFELMVQMLQRLPISFMFWPYFAAKFIIAKTENKRIDYEIDQMTDFTLIDFITCLMLVGIAAAGVAHTRAQMGRKIF